MFLVDSSLLKNLNNSSSNSKLNNHVNFSIGKPANEIQYKTIDRIPWREDQKTASTISSTIFDTPQSNRNETFQTDQSPIDETFQTAQLPPDTTTTTTSPSPSTISDMSGLQPLNNSQYSINNTPQSPPALP